MLDDNGFEFVRQCLKILEEKGKKLEKFAILFSV